MRLVKHNYKGSFRYTIIEVSVTDLALLQLLLIRNGQNELKTEEDWLPSPIPDVKPPLTGMQAEWIGQLIHGVQRGLKMRYFTYGASDNADPMRCTLRAFTHNDGSLYPRDADIRDAYVWTSGISEHWFKVADLLKALDNAINGYEGTNKPMAMIDEEK